MAGVKGHLIPNQRTEATLGWLTLIAAALLLHDAYDRRGRDVPWWGRPFTSI